MTTEIKEKLTAYYTRYYRDMCSLPDWEARVVNRINEEESELEKLKKSSNDFCFDFNNKKHVIVGAGTAGLATVLKDVYQAEAFGVEPEDEEFEIIKLRCIEHGIDPSHFYKAYGESLPFGDNIFDFAHCITVLEHVQDVSKCIDEMIRVVKPGGRIIINTPNYAFPYEGHYKIYFPTFLPKFLGYVYLMLLGKDYHFYKTINRVTEKSVNKILVTKENIKWFRLYKSEKKMKGFVGSFINILIFRRFIYPQQNIVIIKM